MEKTETGLVVKNREGSKLFLEGKVVFRILAIGPDDVIRDKGMVTTLADYQKRLSEHERIALFDVTPIVYQLAYLYDCLNREKDVPRTETFTFWYRVIGTHTWVEWFRVSPFS